MPRCYYLEEKTVNEPKKATLKDVARLCGVTPMTVSKYLNKKSGVSKETGLRIQKAIKELNYTPNLLAKSLRVNKTHTLGVVLSDSTELLFTRMLHGVDEEAFINGYTLVTSKPGWEHGLEREKVCLQMILSKQVDGIIIAAPRNPSEVIHQIVAPTNVPAVQLMRIPGPDAAMDSVTSDNPTGAREITQYLVDSGAQKIHVLSLPPENPSGRARLEAIEQTLAKHKLQFDKSHVHYAARSSEEDGYTLTRQLITDDFDGDTLLCLSDMLAVGALRALRALGVDVPGRIRVTGFDDILMMGNLAVPLTTMRQDMEGMGREAVRLLLRRIANPAAPITNKILPCTLVRRVSA